MDPVISPKLRLQGLSKAGRASVDRGPGHGQADGTPGQGWAQLTGPASIQCLQFQDWWDSSLDYLWGWGAQYLARYTHSSTCKSAPKCLSVGD